jgi:hypothetical protein
VVVQQFQPRRWQVGSEPGDADADVVDVVESGLFGPAVLSAVPTLNPNTDPRYPVLLAESLTAIAV